MFYGFKYRHLDQLGMINGVETGLHIYLTLLYNKAGTTDQWVKKKLLNNCTEKVDYL